MSKKKDKKNIMENMELLRLHLEPLSNAQILIFVSICVAELSRRETVDFSKEEMADTKDYFG